MDGVDDAWAMGGTWVMMELVNPGETAIGGKRGEGLARGPGKGDMRW